MKLKPSDKEEDDENDFSSRGILSTLKLSIANDMCTIITITQ